MIISEIISDFLIAKEIEEGCSQRTIKAYRYDLLMFLGDIGDISIETIKTYHIRKFLKILYGKNYSKNSIARKIACLKSFFNFCFENDIIEKNPMKSIKSPKIKAEEQLPKFLSKDEISYIFKTIGMKNKMGYSRKKRLEIIIPLLYSSMARISEICNLRIRDIDTKQGFIKVLGKGNKERYIPIDKYTCKLIDDQIQNRILENGGNMDGFLFINRNHRPLSPRSLQSDLKKLKEVLGWNEEKKLTAHIFRHTGATHLRQNGMDISELQDLLGHASPNTTRIYAKNDITKLKSSFNKFHPIMNNPEIFEGFEKMEDINNINEKINRVIE